MTLHIEAGVDVAGFRVDVDLTVERGETVALVGPNGAGKSSVLRAIAGLLPVTSGRVLFEGRTWDDPRAGVFVDPAVRRVGVVFQQYLLFDHLSALDNVAFGLQAAGTARTEARAIARDHLERLGLAEVAAQRPATLSGGQAQRVAMARALAISPPVLLLDEPMAALDVSARSAVRHDLQRRMSSIDACRLLVTHDPADAFALADRCVVLEAGRITQHGTLPELAAAPRTSYIADLVGTNLLHGELDGGRFRADQGFELAVGAHDARDGAVLASVRPAAIALHRDRPEGSPRNVWSTHVVATSATADRVRVRLARPADLVVEVTPRGYDALGLDVGDQVWASVKASEITVVPD
ncbi:MAG: ABC transporter ATP-binding protein [Ilumatobacter sp.]|uniref:ABC transporter ATP-binding protein n=1 Tax=Ilumatobacter sp. TaxID=1967498 RepID=UPI00260E47E6|nr:ABC transporter ATP-binding protein [Ilumatobacter sp.]MDJ0770790.1 ABC transporter ATP-binding protein [Ilumatobacter sp.]